MSIASWDPEEAAAGPANVARAEHPKRVEASSVDDPVEEAAKPCTEPEPLVVVVIEASSRLTTPAGHSAMVGKSHRCSSRRNVEVSVLVWHNIRTSSHAYLKVITLTT